ncbi:CAP-Gly domain-containing linker protein 1-like isoform X5 [Leptotrombidium deliense]|uniref:CAP-Gly domain-containing linker protein 1-like isoform X5 n=1 Tax=Leptotrombidium deliense TaxID=299467 RepID=A0A443SMW6_9ACAR|nr:CAP-Gly domain-containing linker protein 1-like isoform X5 [Leptotrombidium deliense]
MSCNKASNSVNDKAKQSSLLRPTTLTRSLLNSSISSLTSDTSEKPSSAKKSSSVEVLNPKSEELKVGDRVYVNGVQPGVIRFLGETSFATGKWAGIELDEENGKNDGSVNGVRYFECKPKYGLFIRPMKATIEPISQSDKSDTESVASTTKSVQRSSLSSVSSLKVGDRVVVNATSGRKDGVLRFLGETEFAAGVWAGVELDEPSGKNDGSVAGKRYFECEMNRGLFAPTSKVSKTMDSKGVKTLKSPSKPLNTATYRKTKAGDISTARRGLSGSQESLNSIASSVSQRSAGIRLGITSLRNQTGASVVGRTNTLGLSSPSSAFRQTIKEKEDHISQLLNERESERGETAKLSLRIDELEQELALLKNEHQRYIQEKVDEIQELRQTIEEGNRIQKELLLQIDEERRKAEVFEFRLEEEMVNSMEIKEEIEKLMDKKSGHKDDRYELQEESIKKSERILQLETNLESKKQEVSSLHGRIREVEEQFKIAEQKQLRYLETIDDLNLRITKSDNEARKMEDVRRQLEEELEQLRENLVTLRNKLSKNDDIMELTDKLRKKDVEIANMASNAKSLQKQLEFLNDEKSTFEEERKETEKLLKEKEKEIHKLQRVNVQLQEDLTRVEELRYSLERQVEDSSRKTSNSNSELNSIRAEVRQKETEIKQLIDDLRRKDDELHELKCETNKQVMEKEDEIRSFKNKECQLREDIAKGEDEKRILQQKIDELLKKSGDSNEHLTTLNEEVKCKQNEIQSMRDEVRTLKSQVSKLEMDVKRYSSEASDLTVLITKKNEEIEMLRRENQNSEGTLNKKENALSSLETSVKNLQSEIETLHENMNDKQKEISCLKQKLHDVNSELKSSEKEKDDLLRQLNDTKSSLFNKENELSRLSNSKYAVEEQTHDLVKQIQVLKEANNDLLLERDKLSLDARNHKNGVSERDETIKKLREQLDVVRKQFDEYRQSLEVELNKSKTESESLLHELKGDVHSVQEENDSLKLTNRDLNEEIVRLREEMRFNEGRNKEVMNEFEAECQRLENSLEEKRKIIDEKNSLLEERDAFLQHITTENESTLEAFKKKVETEKANLIKKIETLESSLNANIATTKSLHSQNGAEKETYESQIDFLNSVIVDMQKKNDDLKSRIQILEEIGVTDFEEPLSEPKLNGHIRAPRLFCDICDVFDAHDTEDCPQQSGQMQDAHSQHQLSRNVERPYCRTCEVFGHWTEACNDNQSF